MILHDRFMAFCTQYPGAEAIDALVAELHLPDTKNIADYLFANRSIVCEIKTLTSETADRLSKFMQESGIAPSALGPGQHEIEKLFLALDDGEAKLKKAITIATRPVADGFDYAEKQIRETKEFFDISDADGLVIILNDQVELASPPLVMARLGQRIAKNANDESPYHANVNHVVFVCEKYVVSSNDKVLNLSLSNPRVPAKNNVSSFANELLKRWAEFNGQPFGMADSHEVDVLTQSKFVIEVEEPGEQA